ncbi:MAG TPA: tetratricopeptide repeat protein [Coleofasciculaceae cyanobacterium]|jgi:tetratricopeptide (TPR) repeat protein
MSDPANRKQVNQKRTATKRLLQYFKTCFQNPKQVNQQQIAAKDIQAGGNVIIGKIVQIIAHPRSVSLMLMRGGFILFVLALLVAAIKGGFSPSNAPSITYAPSTTVENKNTYLINNPPLSLLNKSAPSEAEKKDAQQKVAQYKQEVQKNPNSAVAHTNLGEALRRKGDLEGASKEQQKALQLNPDLQEAKLGQALVEQDKGNATAAEQKIEDILGHNESAIVYNYLGKIIYHENQDIKGAQVAFRKAIELDYNNADSHLLLGAALDLQGKEAEAILEYREAISLAYKNNTDEEIIALSHSYIGTILFSQNKLSEAISEYHKSIETAPKHPQIEETQINLAAALSQKGQWKLAIAECKEAIRINPNSSLAHLVWALTLVGQNLPGKVQIKLEERRLHYRVEIQAIKQKELKEAIEHFKKARDLSRVQGNRDLANGIDQMFRAIGVP